MKKGGGGFSPPPLLRELVTFKLQYVNKFIKEVETSFLPQRKFFYELRYYGSKLQT